MNRTLLSYLWKLPLCGTAFFIGIAISGIALPALGFPTPEMPAGTDSNTIALHFLLGSMILSLALSFVSFNLRVGWFLRWVILFELTWVFGVVGMVIESFFFMTTGAASSILNAFFTVLSFLLPGLFVSVVIAILFRPPQTESFLHGLNTFFSSRNISQWLWRFASALLAYPLIYFTFGLIVQPFIRDFYAQRMYELTTPTWGQLIPLQLTRSFLFLLVSLPVVIWWNGSRRGMWLTLGSSIFALTAFMAVITAYWFPLQMRLFHGLELLADGLIYAGSLVMLLGRKQTEGQKEAENVRREIFANRIRNLQNDPRVR